MERRVAGCCWPRAREDPGGHPSRQVRRLVADISAATEVVGLTIAEFLPRQALHLHQLLGSFPLVADAT
jgi:arginase